MDSKVKKTSAFGKVKKEKVRDGFEERVVQVLFGFEKLGFVLEFSRVLFEFEEEDLGCVFDFFVHCHHHKVAATTTKSATATTTKVAATATRNWGVWD
ncbi:hypothetical protein Hanom_Chr01g00029631 [Helianthus anomalus]